MKRWITTGLVLIAILAVGGFLVVLSGAVPIKASSRHWAITSWFLNFTKERSVSTHTLGKETPDLDSRMLVLKGATHYETGCSPCHGSPGMNQPRIPHFKVRRERTVLHRETWDQIYGDARLGRSESR
jgi:hypothetical protein